MPQFENDPRYAAVIGATEGETILAINNARPPLDDIRVRRALAHAIDKRAVLDGPLFGYGTPNGSPLSPIPPAYVSLSDYHAYYPGQPKPRLAGLGTPSGHPTVSR